MHEAVRQNPLRRLRATCAALGALGPLALFTALAPIGGAAALALTSDRWFPPLVSAGPQAAPTIVLATILLAGLSLVPTHAASLVAGMLFGRFGGTLVALVGIMGAAVLAFAIVRRLVGARLLTQLARHPRAQAVHDELLRRNARRAAGLIALVRLSPVMPFAATNLLLASTGVARWAFLSGSLLGLLPRICAVAIAGAGLSELDLGRAADARLAVLGLGATLLVLVLIGRLARRALRRVETKSASLPDGERG